jgi:hypothetical protein
MLKTEDAHLVEPTELAQKVLAVALEQVIEAGVMGGTADEWAYCTVDPAWELVLQARVWGREQTVTDDFYTTVPRFAHQGREWPVCSSVLSRGVVAARFYPDEDARSHTDEADSAVVKLPPAATLEALAGLEEREIRLMLDAWTQVKGEAGGADAALLFEALCIALRPDSPDSR